MSKAAKTLLISSIIVLLATLYFLSSVVMPFAFASILAYLFDPLVNRLQAWKINRTLGVVIVFVLFLVILISCILVIIPLLQNQIIALINRLPDFFDWIQLKLVPWLNQRLEHKINFSAANLKQYISTHFDNFGDLANHILRTITHSGQTLFVWISNIILIPVVMFYMLRDWHTVLEGTRSLLPRSIEPTVNSLFNQCDEVLSAFLRGQLMVMIALAILYSFGLSIIGLDMAILIGFLSGLVSIVPYLGFIVGIGFASIAAIFQFGDLTHTLGVVLVFTVAQSIESMLLTPLFVGDKIGLHPVAVIFAVLAGGQLFGFVGVLLALPVAAVIMVFIRYALERYRSSKLYSTQPQGS